MDNAETGFLRIILALFLGYGKNGDLTVPFWSTKDAGQTPFTFKIGMGQVIKGWDEGVAGMDLGEIARVRKSSLFRCYDFSIVQISEYFHQSFISRRKIMGRVDTFVHL